jgi:hypothetical protein
MHLLVGDDWAEDDDDEELMDAAGRVLARKRLPESAAGMARLRANRGAPGSDLDFGVCCRPGESGS